MPALTDSTLRPILTLTATRGFVKRKVASVFGAILRHVAGGGRRGRVGKSGTAPFLGPPSSWSSGALPPLPASPGPLHGGLQAGDKGKTAPRSSGVASLAVEAGCPWENGVVESLNSIVRDTLLNTEVFSTVRAAQNMATAWRLEYNHRRGHGALGHQTPAAFAACCPAAPGSAAFRAPQPGSKADDKTMVLS